MSYQIIYEPGDRDLFIIRYQGAVGSEHFYTALNAGFKYPRDAARPYDVIFELMNTQPPPLDVLTKLRKAADLTESLPDLGLIVLVVNNAFAQTLVTAFIQLYPIAGQYYRMVNTVDEARRMIEDHYAPPDLPDL